MENKNYYPIIMNEDGNGFSVINAGTAQTPCYIKIIPKINLHIKIEGLTHNPIHIGPENENLPHHITNAYTPIIIDGETGTITIGDLSPVASLEYYEGYELPRLQPGVNQVKLQNASLCDIEIGFDLRYV